MLIRKSVLLVGFAVLLLIQFAGAQTLDVTDPHGNDTLIVGEHHPIAWITTGITSGSVLIEVNRRYDLDPLGPWESIGSAAYDASPYDWVVTDPTTPTFTARFRVTHALASGMSQQATIWTWILPVEMSSFTATAGDRRVDLRWRTESETNNSYFNLYRSTVANERGMLIGRVDGHGTSATTNNYAYNDHGVANGVTYYYRISDVSLNGVESMNRYVVTVTPTNVVPNEIPIKYSLSQNFPNPFNPTTDLVYALNKPGNVLLTVYDGMGRVVSTLVNEYQTAATYRVSFDGSNLPSGVYYYSLKTNGFETTRKMTLMK